MAFLRAVATTTAIAVCALPAASALSSLLPLNLLISPKPKTQNFAFLFPRENPTSTSFGLVNNFGNRPPVLHMDAPTFDPKATSQGDADLPELLTEYMVDMKCEGCANAVKNKLETVNGVKNVEVDLGNQVVRILASTPVRTLTAALEQTGRQASLIGQGVPEDFLISAAVAEFKGPKIFGVTRLAQVNIQLARIEANFSGLPTGKHGWSINEFGDLTRGAASTGKVFNPVTGGKEEKPLGDLGTLDADDKGMAFFSGSKKNLRIADLIGRSIVIYETEDKSDAGLTAAVIARSAGVGENYKKICTCDGTTIWESSDRVMSKV